MYDPKGKLTTAETVEKLEKLREDLIADGAIPRPIFEVGEKIRIRGAPFRVESLGEKLMTLRPMPWDGGEQEESE